MRGDSVVLREGHLGEIFGDRGQRGNNLCERLGLSADVPVTVVAQDWQERFLPRLDTPEGQLLLDPFIDAHDVIILDNRSCLFDSAGEKDPIVWRKAQDWLLSLRRRGKAVLMGHHANRLGGARGLSNAEDPLNLIVQLARPRTTSRTKAVDSR